MSARGAHARAASASAGRGPGMPRGLAVYLGLYLVFLYLPTLLIPVFSFNAGGQAAFPIRGLTLDWYAGLLGNDRLVGALSNSLVVGLVSAAIATLCGVFAAYADVRGRGRFAKAISAVARLPILIPGVILGIALLVLANLAGPGPSLTAVVLGHVAFCLPLTVTMMRARIAAIPKSLEEAAMDLGAREWTVLRRVVLPLAAPAIGSTFLLAFITSFDEFIVAFFLTGTEPTLPVYIWSQLRFPRELPGVMALGSLILAASVALAAVAELIGRRGLARRRPIPDPRPAAAVAAGTR